MQYQYYKGDLKRTETFLRRTEDGKTTPSPVPNHVKIQYYTKCNCVTFTVERNGDRCINCSISEDGMSLIANIALSKGPIGQGEMFALITEYVPDKDFPGGERANSSPFPTGITLWCGSSSDGLESTGTTVILTNVEFERMKRDLGYNATSSTIALQQGVTGKYVKCSTRSAASNAQFAISKPIDVEACSELLIKTGYNPSDSDHNGLDISVIAIYEEMERQHTVQKQDGNGNPLYYITEADDEGNIHVTEEETTVDTGYPVYVVETYTEYRYLPNNEDRFVAIPDSGHYVAVIPQSCKLVISYKPGVTDMNVIVVKHGLPANLASQLFGIYEHRTMVEAVVSLAKRLEALEDSRGLLGNATAGTLDVSQITKCNAPLTLYGHGVPSADTPPENWPSGLPWDGVPTFIGQQYIDLDASSSGFYYAKGHDAVADWKQA